MKINMVNEDKAYNIIQKYPTLLSLLDIYEANKHDKKKCETLLAKTVTNIGRTI